MEEFQGLLEVHERFLIQFECFAVCTYMVTIVISYALTVTTVMSSMSEHVMTYHDILRLY